MTRHQPKTAALVAYHEGLLQPDSVARLERHLAQCADCSRTLATIRAYEHLSDAIQKASAPALQWDRMERALAAEARRITFKKRVRPVLIGAALAAIVLLGLIAAWPRSAHAPAAEKASTPRGARSHVPDFGDVTAVVGVVTLQRSGEQPQPVSVGTSVVEGARVRSGDNAEAHVRWSEGTGSVIQPGTVLRPVAIGRSNTTLELVEGTISNAVQPLESSVRYVVLAGEWKIRVRGTRFAVYHTTVATAVRVDEGSVELLRNDALVKVLEAPAFWSTKAGVTTPADVRVPRALGSDAQRWPVVHVPLHDGVTRWQIDGSAFDATAPLALRVPLGGLEVVGLDARGLARSIRVDVGPGGAHVHGALRPVEPSAPRVRRGHLAPELIEPVVRGRLPVLRRCYDRALRQHPELRGRYTLRITIDTTGGVQTAALESSSEEPPTDLSECIASQARTWSFPPPTGGIVTFELPLSFGMGPAAPAAPQ